MTKSVIKRGEAGLRDAEAYEAQVKAKYEELRNKPREFFVARGEKAKILFLDDPITEGAFVYRHVKNMGGKQFENITCIRDEDKCPACESGNNPHNVLACTVIVLTPYVSDKGKKYIYQKKLLAVRGDAKTFLIQMNKKRGNLKYCVAEVSRASGAKSPAIGNFDFEGKLTKEKFGSFVGLIQKNIKEISGDENMTHQKYLKPFDYDEVFAPLPKEQMAKIFGTVVADDDTYGMSDDFESDDAVSATDFDTDFDTSEDSGKVDTGSEFEDDFDTITGTDEPKTTASKATDSGDDLVKKAISLGLSPKIAAKKSKDELREWIAEMEGETEEESDGLDDMSLNELRSLCITECGESKSTVSKFTKEDCIELIRSVRAEDAPF